VDRSGVTPPGSGPSIARAARVQAIKRSGAARLMRLFLIEIFNQPCLSMRA